jgi:hypothetical protein
MSVFTYTALREIEPTGYSKAASDISVAAADDSFNQVAAGLLGLLDNEWFLVAGYANAVNNGWFQANGNSTTTKITQDTTTSLVTEAAGPAVTIVGYKRGLNQSYSLEIGATGDRNAKVTRNVQQPMGGGAPEVLLHRRETLIQITTGYISEAQIAQWREFLASVEGGETFTLDLLGTVAAPDDPVSAMLASEEYTEMRVGDSSSYQLSFNVRIL